MAKFKQVVLEKIKTDPDLFAAVCKGMKIKPSAMASTLKRNGYSLNKDKIVTLVAGYLGVEFETLQEKDLPEDVFEKESTESATK